MDNRTPPFPEIPSTYFPDSGGESFPVHRTEKLSSATPFAGLIAPHSKLIPGSVLTTVGSPFSSRLLKYSPLRPSLPLVKTEAGTGSTNTPGGYKPGAYKTWVAADTFARMPASGVTYLLGWPL